MTYNDFKEKYTNFIKRKLKKELMKYDTQTEMAKVFGVSQSTLNRLFNYEDGIEYIKHEDLIELILGEEIFNVDFDTDEIEVGDTLGITGVNGETYNFGKVIGYDENTGIYQIQPLRKEFFISLSEANLEQNGIFLLEKGEI